jgi:hypothetical protein
MILEFIILIAVAFFIAVLFYKQANESFELLQIDSDRMSELPTLYSDHSPIIIKGFPTPALGTEETLRKRPQIMNLTMAPNLSFSALLKSEGTLRNWVWKSETAEFLSKESGLSTWFSHHLFTQLLPSQYTKFLYSHNNSLWIHHRGLFKTTAFQTLIMPTQGTAIVSIMLSKMEPYLPTNWKGREFSSLTPQDTPLLNQIQFLDIKLKKGNALLLPPHLLVNIKTETDSAQQTPAWIFCSEIHHPISKIAG